MRRVPAGRFLLALLPLAVLAACGDDGTGPDDEPFDMSEVEFAAELGVDLSQMEHLGDDLYIQDREVGAGIEAQAGDTLYTLYTGWLPDGTQFDSNQNPDASLHFVLGTGSLIPGWERGLVGMQGGGVRLLVIPPALAYGERGAGDVIPPNSALVFEVELLRIGRPESGASGAQVPGRGST